MRRRMAGAKLLIAAAIMLGGCSSSDNDFVASVTPAPDMSDEQEKALSEEKREGDFILRIESEKNVYKPGEKIKMRALLKYDGPEKTIKIYHGMEPVAMPVVEELTRGIETEAVMPVPLKSSILKQNEWNVFPFKKSGGYSENDPHKDFIKTFLAGDGFPKGKYRVQGWTDFYTEEGDEQQKYHFTTEFIVTVQD
ncbi:hypothetical protein [Paenibacillus sp. NPDC058071]|uniref:hypothetical protein n=1 Tax=Paenibacillus sp. NPDC058071 TaxID=3346326 RepID=UPI0036D86B61